MRTLAIKMGNLSTDGPTIRLELGVDTAEEAACLAAGRPCPAPVQALALIDTGAAISMVRSGLLAPLGISTSGMASIQTPGVAGVSGQTYSVRMRFPQGFMAEAEVAEIPLVGQPYDCLIGRDVLAHAVFVYLGDVGVYTLSF